MATRVRRLVTRVTLAIIAAIACVALQGSMSGEAASPTSTATPTPTYTATPTDTATPTPSAMATVVTQILNASNGVITGTAVASGTVIHDEATVTVNAAAPFAGSVTFHRFSTVDCTGPSVDQPVMLIGGPMTGVADSSTFTTGGGPVSYMVHFNGDIYGYYPPADGTCEPLAAQLAPPPVGGMTDLKTGGVVAPSGVASHSGSSSVVPDAVLPVALVAAAGLGVSGWYVRRRWLARR